MSAANVELGFAEKTASWKLKSKFFRSKIGGRPSWLCLNKLPEPTELQCQLCKNPCVFLMQVYAPLTENDNTFHRTISVFVCRKEKCNKRNSNDSFIVFRSQLPRKNEYYSFEPPVDLQKDSDSPSAEQFQPMCDICYSKATIKCDKCSKRNYCSEVHRDNDWLWGHKAFCEGEESNANGARPKKMKNFFLLPEFEIVIDSEDLPRAAPEKSEEEKMKEYRQFMSSSKAPKELQDVPMDDVDHMLQKNDKIFNKFQKRVKHEPEQILRYQKGGQPLWVSAENIPNETEIPPCACGAKRVFEFQIMPQLLNYLALDTAEDSVDWGTLAIFTCYATCDSATAAYTKEFLWKQDFRLDAEK